MSACVSNIADCLLEELPGWMSSIRFDKMMLLEAVVVVGSVMVDCDPYTSRGEYDIINTHTYNALPNK